jgi:hypothetical protein
MQAVRILAPETSNVDVVAYDMIDDIAADSQALAATYAWATHSYNLCMTKKMRDKVAPYGKEYWQTEASSNDPEDFNDELQAVKAAGRVLGDLNLGVTQWFWFLAYAPFLAESNTPRLIGFDQQTGEYRAFLKYYYLKQLSFAFNPGTVFRTCSTSLVYEPDHMFDGKDRYAWMENDYGEKPPLCAACGVNPDGTWSLAVCNQTGIVSFWNAATYLPEAVYDVTFDVEELRDSGEKKFDMIISDEDQRIQFAQEVTMTGGKVTAKIKPHQLITLWPHSKTTVDIIENPGSNPLHASGSADIQSVTALPGSGYSIIFNIPSPAATFTLALHDIRGRLISEIASGNKNPGKHIVRWNGLTAHGLLARGAYVLKFECGGNRSCKSFIISR